MSAGSSDSGERRTREIELEATVAGAPIDPALLARVMEQTLAAADDKDTSVSGDLQRLKAIAHRRKGQNLVLEPVVIEMVRAMLGAEFAGLEADPERFKEVTMKIARTLLDDPTANKRLESLWSRLNEGDAKP
jgi:hypothetical protein